MRAASPSSGRCQGVPRLLLLSLGLVLLLTPTPTQQFDFSSLLSTVADNVINRLYNEGEMELLGHYCTYSRRPYFYKWELHYRAQVNCPGWSTIIGKAEGYLNPTSAEREATRDFVRQAVERELVTPEEASEWL
ncbi:anti-lipopolysaccharide factor-like [Panulirus ornatus]|uniref:anti-lipopolysaccharide factor-like n=1 Tax=Panulirus ornatus TaxID=150431 RepID=UPI003A896B88